MRKWGYPDGVKRKLGNGGSPLNSLNEIQVPGVSLVVSLCLNFCVTLHDRERIAMRS